jgi:hypothetical protein
MLCYVSIEHNINSHICCSFHFINTNGTEKNMFAFRWQHLVVYKSSYHPFCCKKCRFFYTLSILQYCEFCHTCNWHVAIKIDFVFFFLCQWTELCHFFLVPLSSKKYVKFQAIKCASNLAFYRFNNFDFLKSQTFVLKWESYDAIFYWDNKMFYSLDWK